MRDYPDPKEFLDSYMERSIERYADGLQKANIQPNDTLINALFDRTLREAKANYLREADEIHYHNIQAILRDHKNRMNEMKRSGASLRLKTCPIFIVLFGLLAWYSLSHPAPGSFIPSICYAATSLVFLAMLILGAIADRPTE